MDINDLISGLDYAYPGRQGRRHRRTPQRPHGSLLLDDQVVTGAVVCSIGGLALDTVVAQGCRPIGPVFAIEQVQRNVLLELSDGERRASPMACLQRVLADLSERRPRTRASLVVPGCGTPQPARSNANRRSNPDRVPSWSAT